MPVSYYRCPLCGETMTYSEALVFYPEVHTELDEKPVEMIGMLQCIWCGCDDLEEVRYGLKGEEPEE